jgi:multidrug efflux pump subunit AcrA (membrane-fusion protein)
MHRMQCSMRRHMLRSMRRWFSFWLAGISLLGMIWFSTACTVSGIGQAKDPSTPTPMPTSAVAANPAFTVQRGDVIKEITIKGRVVPVVEQRLFFRNSGYVRDVYARWGDSIEAGQKLADLEIGDLENQLAQAEINLKSNEIELVSARQAISDTLVEAQVSLSIAQLRLEEARYYEEQDNRLPQRIAVQIQEQQIRLAELRLEQLQRGPDPRLVQAVDLAHLTIDRLKAQVADASIVAPFDGKVLALNIQKGDSVTAFSQTAMTVYEPSQIEVAVEFTPDQLKELHEGVAVNIKRSSQPGEPWEGVVRCLPYPYGTCGTGSQSGESDTSSRIKINLSPDQAGYKLGDIVDVQVVLERVADALWLPPQAIRNFEGRKFVVVQEGERQRRVNVTLGIEGDRRVEIVEGLKEGQVVVSP